MAPQTRKSQASSSQEHNIAITHHVDIPADLSTNDLSALLGHADWTAPTADNILSVYRLVIQQKQDFDLAFREWEERLAQKDAEVEQALHDQEAFRAECTEQIDSLRTEIEALKNGNEALEKDRATLRAQLATLSSSTSESGVEVQQLRIQVEEREKEKKTLTDTLDATLARENRLHSENTELRAESQTVRKTVSELQAKLAMTTSAEATLQFKVSTLEQQISLLQEGNDKLNNEYSEQLSRYAELRRTRTEEVSNLQIKLDQKTTDHDREAERARSLYAANGELERKLNETLEKNRDLQSNETANSRAFQEEMQICKDLLKQYEKIADDAKARVADIESEEEGIRNELARREESLLAQTERERERAEAAERKVEELEEVLQRVQVGEFSMADASFSRGRTPMSPGPAGMTSMTSLMLSPTASIVSKFQRGGRSITEVYADYVRLQKELQQTKQENARLETTLNDVFNEIQDRAPVITQQRLEYERVSAEARQLANQLGEAMEDRDQQARAAREAKHTLVIKQKEIDMLNKTSIDNSRQIRGLMHQVARLRDPTLPEEIEENLPGPENGVQDIDSYVSSNLVLFRSLPQLQKQNQELLKLTRNLTAQLDERDRQAASEEESEVMAEARMVIENQAAELNAGRIKLEAYIKERDALKKKVMQLQAGGATESGNSMVLDGVEDYHHKYDEEHSALESLKRESARDFESLRSELKQAKAELTELHVALGKSRATVEYHIERNKMLQDSAAMQANELKALAGRNTNLEVYVRQSEAKNGELGASLATLSANANKMENEVQLLRSEKALQKSREDRLEQENRQLHADRARNNQTLEDYRRMKDELASMWDENKQALEKEKTRLTAEVTALRDEVMNDRSSARTRVTEKEAEIRDLNHRLSQLREEATKARENAAVAQATQGHLQARADDLNRQLQRALEKLAVFERRPGTIGLMSTDTGGTEEENLRAQVAELSAELKSAQVELTRERANVAMYQELAQTAEMALEEERRTKDETIAKAQQDLAVKDAQLLSLQERLAAVQSELQSLADQKATLEAEMEAKEAQFLQEKNVLEGIVSDVNGADERAIRAQQVTHQELLAEAAKTREAQQKYQVMLVDHASALKERDTLYQQLQEAQLTVAQHLEDAKAARSILSNSQKSWELQAESLKQEVTDAQTRYDSVSKQNDILHKQLASVTAQAAKLGELSDSTMAAMEAPSSDVQVQELQQVIQHIKREADLLRGQQELLKRENARLNGDIRRLTSELEFTRQRLSEERELASKASLAPNDQQALLAKVSENAALIESNRSLRSEKAALEERLAKKSDELIASQSEISPLKQDVITLRSERDYIKIENEALQNSIDQWRKRATSIMTKFERIDPEAHEQLKTEKEQLEGEIGTLKAQLTRANEQVARWKDAQQQWKNAVQTVTEQSKERQSQLAAERDAATAQSEAITKELESARAELATKNKLAPDAGKAVPAADSTALTGEIKQLSDQKAALQAENSSLKEQLASLQANPATAAPPADVEKYQQQVKEAQQKFTDLQTRARGMALEIKNRGEKIAALEREKASAAAPADVETVVAQRLQAAVAQAKAEQEAAITAAVIPLQQQIAALSQGQPDLAQLRLQHEAEIKALQDQLAAASAGGVSDAAIEERINQRLAALNAEHTAALARATESGRMEAETKFKMLQMQFTKVRNELAQLKAAQAATTGPASAIPANAGAQPTTPASPTVTRGRGRGVAPGRGTPGARGGAVRGAAPGSGLGRGSVLDAVNQAIAGGSASPGTPATQLSILGASGQKRGRDEEEAADPGSLAKRMKPGDGGLPPKPAGRGTPINRGRIPGAPGGPA